MRRRHIPILLLAGVLLASCSAYRQNILFEVSPGQIQQQVTEAETNYQIQPNDFLTLDVFTNQGERIVDPNGESFQEGPGPLPTNSTLQYLVDAHGDVKFPLIETTRVAGLTLRQAEAILNEEYEKYYEGAYAVLQFTNKRVVVLGAPGGQVIPLHHANMRLTEVLALASGIDINGRASNIRVIRADQVYVADLSTFEGYQKGNLVMRPGDIVYVEPVSRPFIEGLRDYSPVINIVTGLATLIFIISQVNK